MIFLANFINFAINVLIIIIFIRVILSWFAPNSENSFVKFITEATNPLLLPFKKFSTAGMFDFSPIIAMIVLELIRQILLIIIR